MGVAPFGWFFSSWRFGFPWTPVRLGCWIGSAHGLCRRQSGVYDVIAGDYAAQSSTVWAGLEANLAVFCAAVPAGSLVADVGCGPGRDSELLRGRGMTVVGLDLSIGMLLAGAGGPVVQADMRAIPLRSASLDGIWSQAALLHVDRADVPGVLAEFARVVRPGGSVFLNAAEGEGERWEQVPYRPDQRRWFVYHQRADLEALVSRAGFAITTVTTESAKREWINVHATRGDG
jgi:SAM-dependent methyltransferase